MLQLRVWPGTGEWTLYEDDGHSFEYRTGAFATLTCRAYAETAQTVIEIDPRQGNWSPPQREIIVELVGAGEQRCPDDGTAHQFRFQ